MMLESINEGQHVYERLMFSDGNHDRHHEEICCTIKKAELVMSYKDQKREKQNLNT